MFIIQICVKTVNNLSQILETLIIVQKETIFENVF